MAARIFEGTQGSFVVFTDVAEVIPPGARPVTVTIQREGFEATTGQWVQSSETSTPGQVWWEGGTQHVYVDSGTLESLWGLEDLRLRLLITPEGEKEDPDARTVSLWALAIHQMELVTDDEDAPSGEDLPDLEETEEILGKDPLPSTGDSQTPMQPPPLDDGEEQSEEEDRRALPATNPEDVAAILRSNVSPEPSARSSDNPGTTTVIETVPRATLGTVVQTTFNMHQLGARMSGTKLGGLLASEVDFDPDFLPSDLSSEEREAYFRARKADAELRKEGAKDAKIDVVLSAIKGAELNSHPIDVASFHEVSNADTFADGLVQNAGKYGLQIDKHGEPVGAAREGITQYTLVTGPLLETGGEGGAQKEHYPILFRTDRFDLTQTRYFITHETGSAPLKQVPANRKIETAKGKSRPLVVYTLQSRTDPGAPPLHVVVVHTKPNASHRVTDSSGDDATGEGPPATKMTVKARYKIFDQVKHAYRHAAEDAESTGARWTFIGDHYLANNEHAYKDTTFQDAVTKLGLTSFDPIPKTNTHEKMDTELSTFRAMATLRELGSRLDEAERFKETAEALLALLDKEKTGSLDEAGKKQLASLEAWIRRQKKTYKVKGSERDRLQRALDAVADIQGRIDGSKAAQILEAANEYKKRTEALDQALKEMQQLTPPQLDALASIEAGMLSLGGLKPAVRDQTRVNNILKRIKALEEMHGKDAGKLVAAERRRDEGKDRKSPFLRTATLEGRIKDLEARIAALEEQKKGRPLDVQQAITERIERLEAALEQAGRELEAARQFQASIGDRSGASHLDRGSAQVADKGVGTKNNSVNLTGIVALRAAAGLHDPEIKEAGRFLTSDAQNSELARTMVHSDHAMFVWVSSDRPEDKQRIDAMADDRPPPRLPSSAFGLESDDEGGEDDDPDDEDIVSADEMDDESTLSEEETSARASLKRSRATWEESDGDEGDSMDQGSGTTPKTAQKTKKDPAKKRKKVEKGPKKPVGSTHVGAVKAPGQRSRTKAQSSDGPKKQRQKKSGPGTGKPRKPRGTKK